MGNACQRVLTVEEQRRLHMAAQLREQSEALMRQKRYAEALTVASSGLATVRSILSNESADTLLEIHYVATLQQLNGHLDKAEAMYKEVLAGWKNLKSEAGDPKPNNLPLLASLAGLYLEQERFDESESLYQEILKQRKEKDQSEIATRLKTADTLYGLGVVLWNKKNYNTAKQHLEHALSIQKEALPRSLTLARTEHVLGHVYRDMGEYGLAEPMIRSALQIRKTKLAPNDLILLASYRLLALLHNDQGDVDKAEAIMQIVFRQYKKQLGLRSKLTLAIMSDLASIYRNEGQSEKARPLLHDVANLKEKTLGLENLSTARSIANWADLLREVGEYEASEKKFTQAIQIYEKIHETAQPEFADLLNNFGLLYQFQGLFDKAFKQYERGIKIGTTTRGQYYPGTLRLQINQALLELARDNRTAGLAGLTTAFMSSEYTLQLAQLSESRLDALLNSLQRDADTAYSLPSYCKNDPSAVSLALAMLLLRKGRSLDELVLASSRRLHPPAEGHGQSDAAEQNRLRILRSNMARRLLSLQGQTLTKGTSQDLGKIAQELERLDQQLASLARIPRALTQPPSPQSVISGVQKALEPGTALLEVALYQPYLFKAKGPAAPWDEPRYQAFLLFADKKEIHSVDLGPARQINTAVLALRQSMASSDTKPKQYVDAAKHLYKLLFENLRPYLGETNDLYLSLDGQLQEVPFAALHDKDGFLLGRYHFSYLSSGRDLSSALTPSTRKARSESPLRTVVLADPDYAHAKAQPGQVRGLPEQTRSMPLRPLLLKMGTLPGFKAEATMLKQRLPGATLLLGPDATEQALFIQDAPSILHIATHGIFLEDARIFLSRAKSQEPRTEWTVVKDALPRDENTVVGSSLALPLLCRSALMLAGVNGPRLLPQPYDGLATPLEVTSMNLHGTQLVILSACDTGRGVVSRGQGIYGMRRAFRIAGAETVVTSLWRIHDTATAELMDKYYEQLLLHRMGRVKAMEKAMEAVKIDRVHPYYWAPFIVIGERRPLRGL